MTRSYISGMPSPGAVVGKTHLRTSAVATGTGTVTVTDALPDKIEGDNYLFAVRIVTAHESQSNLLDIRAELFVSSSNADVNIAGALFFDSDTPAVAAVLAPRNGVANAKTTLVLRHLALNRNAGAGAVGTINLRAGTASAGTTTVNGSAGARLFGGVAASSLTIDEIMT